MVNKEKQQVVLNRESKARQTPGRIKLGQLSEQRELYAHRDDKDYKPDKLRYLAESMALEGQHVPTVVVATGNTILVDNEQLAEFSIISGFRRTGGQLALVKQKAEGWTLGTEIDVQLIERGSDQSEESWQRDLLLRSIDDNEAREKLDNASRLRAAKKMDDMKISLTRAARALGHSDTNHERLLDIIRCPRLHDMVVADHVGLTTAARFIKKANDKSRVDDLLVYLDSFIEDARAKIAAKLAEKKRLGKKPTDSDSVVKRYLTADMSRQVEACLDQGLPIDDGTVLAFGVAVTDETLEIKGLRKKLSKLAPAEIERIIGELKAGASALVPTLMAAEARRKPSELEVAARLAEIDAKTKAAADEKRQQEAGRPKKSAAPTTEPGDEE